MISFAICTHNEGQYIQDLFDQLVPFCEQTGDELVVVDDNSTDKFTITLLETYSTDGTIKLSSHELNNDFAAHKNYLIEQCSGEYIFQIDADEIVNKNLLANLHTLVEYNNEVDLFLIPRVNVVTGMTDEDVIRYGWTVNDNGWIMFPDYQTRLFRNSENIRWVGKVHERITGFSTSALLPAEEEWSLYHIKDVVRQREQNNFYSTL